MFVPPDYTGQEAVPAILYLHGAGRRGSDGRSQIIERPGEGHPREKRGFPIPRHLPASPRRGKLDAGVHRRQPRPCDPQAGPIRVSRRPRSNRAHWRFHGWSGNLESGCGRSEALVGDRADLPRLEAKSGGAPQGRALLVLPWRCRYNMSSSRVRWSERSRRLVESHCTRSSSASTTITPPTMHTPHLSSTNGCCSRIVPDGR